MGNLIYGSYKHVDKDKLCSLHCNLYIIVGGFISIIPYINDVHTPFHVQTFISVARKFECEKEDAYLASIETQRESTNVHALVAELNLAGRVSPSLLVYLTI